MDVIVDVRGQVVVHHLHHVGDVQPARGHVRRHQHGTPACLERAEGVLPLPLGLIPVDGTRREALLAEHVLHVIAVPLGLDEYEDQSLLYRHQEAHQMMQLVLLLHVLDRLRHVLAGAAHPSHREEDVVPHEVPREPLDVRGKRRAEHHRLADPLPVGHPLLLDYPANLRLKTHVEHPVRLVEHEELDILHGEAPALDEVHQAAGGGHQQIAAALDLAQLIPDVGTAVDDDGGDARAVEELLGLVLDLARQLARGGQDQALGVGPPPPDAALGLAAAVAEHRDDDREEEARGLPAAGLGARHEIPIRGRDGDAPLLHRRGLGVTAQLRVPVQILPDVRDFEGLDREGHVGAGGLHRDAVVRVEVYASGLLDFALEQLLLEARVGAHVTVETTLGKKHTFALSSTQVRCHGRSRE